MTCKYSSNAEGITDANSLEAISSLFNLILPTSFSDVPSRQRVDLKTAYGYHDMARTGLHPAYRQPLTRHFIRDNVLTTIPSL